MKLMTRRNAPAGLSVIEALVGTFIVTLIFFAFWMTTKTNSDIWSRGKDKVLLQQALSQASDAMERDIRAGASILLASSSDITIYDRAGNAVRRYYRDGSAQQLVTAPNAPVVPENCTAVTFTITPPDTAAIRFILTLKDRWENKATVRGSAHLRNS